VLITQAFLHEPDLVFIDEPLTNLDPIMQERAKTVFREFREDGGTIFLSTHFIGTAQAVCTRIGIVNRGRLLSEVDPRDLDSGETLLDRFFAVVDSDGGVAVDPATPEAEAEAEADGGTPDRDAEPRR
jgi:ABC-2 type transport system ATP-binding protein